MTNAEKMAKDTEFLQWLAGMIRRSGKPCWYCAFRKENCEGKTCTEGFKMWLESEAEE